MNITNALHSYVTHLHRRRAGAAPVPPAGQCQPVVRFAAAVRPHACPALTFRWNSAGSSHCHASGVVWAGPTFLRRVFFLVATLSFPVLLAAQTSLNIGSTPGYPAVTYALPVTLSRSSNVVAA